MNMEFLNKQAEEFNKKHGTQFNFSAFIGKIRGFSMMSAMRKDQIKMANFVYTTTLNSLCLAAIENAFKEKKVFSDLEDVVNDFENDLIQPLREELKKDGDKLYPNTFGGMRDRGDRLKFIGNVINSVPQNAVQAAEKAYLEGKIRIRDMVKFTKDLFNNKDVIPDMELQKQAAAYALALENVNKNRSGVWRFFHRFRNNAETRDAKVIRDLLGGEDNDFANKYAFDEAPKEFNVITGFKINLNSATKLYEIEKGTYNLQQAEVIDNLDLKNDVVIDPVETGSKDLSPKVNDVKSIDPPTNKLG